MPTVFLGLGSNIDPEQNLREAARMLRLREGTICFSSVYRTKAQGYGDQPDFLNAAARLETDDPPEVVKAELEAIERALGKAIPFRFGPRTIDLDLLLYGNMILPSAEEWRDVCVRWRDAPVGLLYVPHPRMHERRFVLEPLLELNNPEEHHPVLGRSWHELLGKCASQECAKTTLQWHTHA